MSATRKAWFELMRLSNLPTVLSGAFVITLGGALRFVTFGDLVTMLVAISCFYAAGFIFNDVFDRHIDADERRHRPIPSGRIRTHSAVQIGVLLIAAGLLLVGTVDQLFHTPDSPRGIPGGLLSAVLLVICMLLYNRFHAKSAWTVFLMAACRALVYVTCILVYLDTPEQYDLFVDYFFSGQLVSLPLIFYIIAIFLYVAGFSRIARGEATPTSAANKYCYHCGQGIDSAKIDRCPECGKELEPAKVARSTQPPINRTIEWFSLAATFVPILGLGTYFIVVQASPQVWAKASGYSVTFADQIWTYAYGLLIVLVAVWLIVATIRYCRDRTNPGKSILMWLAGIPLLDSVLAYELGLPWWATAICLGLFVVTIWGHRRIPGT